MTVSNHFFAHSVRAAADLRAAKYRVINLAGTLFDVAGGNSGRAAGVLEGSVNSGEHASVNAWGIVKVTAGAAVQTLGYPLQVASGGFMIAATSGGVHYGRALETCASGDLVKVFVDFFHAPMWGGT